MNGYFIREKHSVMREKLLELLEASDFSENFELRIPDKDTCFLRCCFFLDSFLGRSYSSKSMMVILLYGIFFLAILAPEQTNLVISKLTMLFK